MIWYIMISYHIYVYYIIHDVTDDMVYHEIMYDIVYYIVYEILQYIGRIGIPRLRKVASMYRTIEIGTFPGPTLAWAIWNETEPLACPPRMRSPFVFLYSLNAKCWQPSRSSSATNSRTTSSTRVHLA